VAWKNSPQEILDSKGFVETDELDESYVDALLTKNRTAYLRITKYAVQKFIEQCLRPDGQFRGFYNRMQPFTGDFVVNEDFDGDPSKRHIQIATYYGGMREMEPAIFINDSGYTYTPASLGGLSGGWNECDKEGNQIVHITDLVPVPLELTIAAVNDHSFVEHMCAFLSSAFGADQRFLTNWILRPNKITRGRLWGAYWEVRVGQGHSASAMSSTPLRGDAEDHVWTRTFSLELDFENSSYYTYRANPKIDFEDTALDIRVPTTIPVHNVIPVHVSDMPYPITMYSDNLKVALIEQRGSTWYIHPKRIGKFKLLVAKPGGTEKNIEIYAEKEITVTLR
jgi:hypothetical protein